MITKAVAGFSDSVFCLQYVWKSSQSYGRIKVTDACQSLIGTFSTLRRCVVFGRMLHGASETVTNEG